jgi:hypothetical protein
MIEIQLFPENSLYRGFQNLLDKVAAAGYQVYLDRNNKWVVRFDTEEEAALFKLAYM